MTSTDPIAKFESLHDCHKGPMIEAAYGIDVIWINMGSIYNFEDSDLPKVRAYIRRTYHSNGQPQSRKV